MASRKVELCPRLGVSGNQQQLKMAIPDVVLVEQTMIEVYIMQCAGPGGREI